MRDWHYRYCWVCDATFSVYVLMTGGYIDDACAWRDWLLRAVVGNPSQLNIYGFAGVTDGVVARYLRDLKLTDCLRAKEPFLACSFWLADNLALLGQHDVPVIISSCEYIRNATCTLRFILLDQKAARRPHGEFVTRGLDRAAKCQESTLPAWITMDLIR